MLTRFNCNKKFIILCIAIFIFNLIGCTNTGKKEVDLNFLKTNYYEDEKLAFFHNNAFDVLSNNINIYTTSWYLSIVDLFGYKLPLEDKETLKKIISSNKPGNQKIRYNKIYDTFLWVQIESKMGLIGKNKLVYVKNLKDNLGTDGLYFWRNKDESLNDKITATYLALQTYQMLDVIPPNFNQTKAKVMELFVDDANFDKKDLKINLVNKGVPLINILQLLHVDLKQIDYKLVEKRQEWISYWNKELYKLTGVKPYKDTIPINEIILQFNPACKYLNVEPIININYIEHLKAILGTEGEIYVQGDLEPQLTFKAIKVLQIFNEDMPFKYELYKNVVSRFHYGWDYQISSFNLKDNYFGLGTAIVINMKFNKKKASRTLERYYKKNNLTIEETYYYVLSLKELNSIPSEKREIISKVNKLQERFKDTVGKSEIKNVYFLVSIFKNLHMNPATSINPAIKSFISNELVKLSQNDCTEEELFYVVSSAHQLKINVDRMAVVGKIQELYLVNEGGYVHDKKALQPNIYSTYRMVELRRIMYDPLDNNKNQILKFINLLHGNRGGYYIAKIPNQHSINSYKTYFSLESFYNAVFLQKLLSL